MARPKMTVAAALARSGVQEVDTREGAKQPVKLENGRVVHMRVKKSSQTSNQDEIHSGLDDDHTKQSPPQNLVAEGGGSSSVKLESHEDDEGPLTSHHAPDYLVELTPLVMETHSNVGKGEEFMCTACGRSVDITQVRGHPVLHVGVCDRCYEFLFSSPFTKDNPQDPDEHENECRWCGDGGEVVLCDTCPKAFCKPCITRNFGAETLHAIESSTRQWQCFACDSELLQDMVLDYESKAKTMNQAPKRKTSSRKHKSRAMIQTTNPEESIASIIAHQKAQLLRKHPGKHFTGFDMQIQRQPKSLFEKMNGNKSEHGTFKRGARSTSSVEWD